jgi:probable phosphoglycerate mutase
MLLYIVCHGDPIYETDSLTERGKLQAEAVGKRIADSKIDRIFSSPMGRAKMTAEPACRLLGLDYTVEDWTHEIEEER